MYNNCVGCLFGEYCLEQGACFRDRLNAEYHIDNEVANVGDVADIDAGFTIDDITLVENVLPDE